MYRCWILLFLVSSVASAVEYKVVERDLTKKVIAIKYSEGEFTLKNGDKVVATVGEQSCSLPITRINSEKKFFIASIVDCEIAKDITNETKISESVLNDVAEVVEKETAKESTAKSELRSDNESWYSYWGLGFGSVRYGNQELQDALDSLKDNPMVDHLTVAVEIFGFYWPVLNHTTMLGFVMSGASETFKQDSNELTINQYQYSFSVMRFFGTNIGDGLFIRGDVGPVKYTVEGRTSTESVRESSDWGYGVTFGGGYAFPLSRETRMLFNLNLSLREAEKESIRTLVFGAGWLF